MKGSFIVFEGIDGSGKGSLVRLARDYLLRKGIPVERVVVSAEPTEGKFGRLARELSRTQSDPQKSARECLDLYVKDRREHVKSVIMPALCEGKIVLCDRFKYSTLVYQALQGISEKEILSLHEGMPVPELVLVLDVSVKVALQRIELDGSRKMKEKFEQEAFLERARERFRGLSSVFLKENIHVILAEGSVKEVFESLKPFLDAVIR
ncbi:MAG: dTMP kinase [Candidatus Diapherotrites archaeon]|nr:dTMP kinase [Candidatus Diapherotrites archaeon]